MMMKRCLWSLTLFSAAPLMISGCSHEQTTIKKPVAVTPISVKTTTVQKQKLSDTTSFPASVRSRRQATLASKLAGLIEYLQVEEGDFVSANSVVVEIDTSSLQARTLQAQASRNSAQASHSQSQAALLQSNQAVIQARTQLKTLQQQQEEALARLQLAVKENQRYRALAEEGAVPRQRADQAGTELQISQSRVQQLQSQEATARVAIDQAKAAVASAHSAVVRSEAGIAEASAGIGVAASDLAYGSIRAPFRGLVVEKLAYQGELNTPGRPLLKLQDLDQLEITLNLPESRLENVQRGKILKAEIPSSNSKLELKVRQIIASANPTTHSVEVRLTPLSVTQQLLPGTFVRVHVAEKARPLIIIPEAALAQRGQLIGVFVVSRGSAEFRLLQVGQHLSAGREVLSGLEVGEEVILEPGDTLEDGQKVIPQ